MATNYVLVDFENVQPDSLEALASGAFRVKVFVGAQQARGRVSFEFSESMQKLGSHAEYVRIARSGPNAVDMHIAYYVGRLLEKESHAAVFVISRDTDFDPLVEYLQAKGSNCRRVKSIAELVKLIPKAVAPAAPKSASRAAPPSPAKKAQSDRLAPIIKHLHSLRGKPSTRKSLATTIGAYFKQHGGALGDKVVEQLIDELIRLKYVSQSGPKVSYHLS
jgi:PIN domain